MGNCLKCFNTNNSNENAVSTQRIQISEKISQDSRFGKDICFKLFINDNSTNICKKNMIFI